MEVNCKIINIVGSLATKAIALGDRSEAKDHYDIYSLISYYKDGAVSCAKEIKPFLKTRNIEEAMDEIKRNYTTETSLGPTLVGSSSKNLLKEKPSNFRE